MKVIFLYCWMVCSVHGGHKGATDPLELELQTVVRPHEGAWVLGTESGPSARVAGSQPLSRRPSHGLWFWPHIRASTLLLGLVHNCCWVPTQVPHLVGFILMCPWPIWGRTHDMKELRNWGYRAGEMAALVETQDLAPHTLPLFLLFSVPNPWGLFNKDLSTQNTSVCECVYV